MRQAGWIRTATMVGKTSTTGTDKAGFSIFASPPRWADDDKYALCDFTKYAGAVIVASGT